MRRTLEIIRDLHQRWGTGTFIYAKQTPWNAEPTTTIKDHKRGFWNLGKCWLSCGWEAFIQGIPPAYKREFERINKYGRGGGGGYAWCSFLVSLLEMTIDAVLRQWWSHGPQNQFSGNQFTFVGLQLSLEHRCYPLNTSTDYLTVEPALCLQLQRGSSPMLKSGVQNWKRNDNLASGG